jgi:hypothetical protein
MGELAYRFFLDAFGEIIGFVWATKRRLLGRWGFSTLSRASQWEDTSYQEG